MMNGLEIFFEKHSLFSGFKKNFSWNKGPNHCNPYYSPLYYAICKQLQAKNILEIGVEQGYSSFMLATVAKEAGGHYYCIEKVRKYAEQLKKGLVEIDAPHTVFLADSKDVKELPINKNLDFVLLDGDHSKEAICHEFNLIYNKIQHTSMVALHDIGAWSASGFLEIINNKNFNFEYITFPNNYGLGLFRKKRENYEKILKELADKAELSNANRWKDKGNGRIEIL